jgi:hypothetical protein
MWYQLINRICYVCSEYVQDVWVVILRDDKEYREFEGHRQCIDQLHNRIDNVKDLDKKSVQKVLKELKMN